MNNTLLAALQSAENMINLAQDATKDKPFSPFINAGLEQLNKATVELANAMTRVKIKGVDNLLIYIYFLRFLIC